MKRIAYLSEINCENLGDIIINGLLIRELSKNGIVYIYGNPCDEVKEIYEESNEYLNNIKNIKFKYSGKYLREIYFIIILLMGRIKIDYYFLAPGHVYGVNGNDLYKFILRFIQISILAIKNIKLVIFGATFGPFDWVRMALYKIFSVTTNKLIIYVRDKVNYDELKKCNFKNIGLIPDLSYLYDNNSEKKSSILDIISGEKYDIVSFRSIFEGRVIDEKYSNAIIERICEMIRYKNKKNKNIITVLSHQVNSDIQFMEYVYEKVKEKFNSEKIIIIKKRLTLDDALQLYKYADNIYTNRLHVFLLAEISGKRAVVITDIKRHSKIVNYMMCDEVSDLLLDAYAKNIKWDSIDCILKNYKDDIKEKLIKNKAELKDTINSIF